MNTESTPDPEKAQIIAEAQKVIAAARAENSGVIPGEASAHDVVEDIQLSSSDSESDSDSDSSSSSGSD